MSSAPSQQPPAAPDSQPAKKPTRNWKRNWVRVKSVAAFSALLVATYLAASWVGQLFGWLVGASVSPITGVAAPLIFGLLAVAGITIGFSGNWSHPKNMLRLAVAGFGVWLFCNGCMIGMGYGVQGRTQPYPMFRDLLGESYDTLNTDTVSQLYRFRWRAKNAGVRADDFSEFIQDVVQPLAADGDAQAEIEDALRVASESLPATKAE